MGERGYGHGVSRRHVALRVGAVLVLALSAAIVSAGPAAAAAPSAPTITAVVAGPDAGTMTVRWSPPRDNGGALVTAYQYRVQIDSGPFSLPAAVPGGAMSLAKLPCLAPALAGHG